VSATGPATGLRPGPKRRVPTVIPADVDKEDRLLAGLTARQLAILAVAGVAAWGVIVAAKTLLPLPVAAALAAALAALGAVLALGRRDGLPADRLALAALRQRRAPRRQVLAPEGVTPAPAWAQAGAAGRAAGRQQRGGSGSGGVPGPSPGLGPDPAPLAFPARRLDDDGVIDLGPDGAALVCQASPVNLGLRTPAEQDALVAAFARLLNAVTAPLQILVRAEQADLRAAVAALRDAAGGLPHPALEAACREHAAFLDELAARRDVLRRQVLVVLREPAPAAAATAGPALRRRAQAATASLAAAGITLTPLDGHEAAEVLHRAADPEAPPRPPGLAPPDAIITTAGGAP